MTGIDQTADAQKADAVLAASKLDYLNVHVTNKDPHTVCIECSIGGVPKQACYKRLKELVDPRSVATAKLLSLNWEAEACSLIAAVVEDARLFYSGVHEAAASSKKDSTEEDEAHQNEAPKDVQREVQSEINKIKEHAEEECSREAMVRSRNDKVHQERGGFLAIHGGDRHFAQGLDRFYGKPPAAEDDNVLFKMMEKEFLRISIALEALEMANEGNLDSKKIISRINEADLPSDICSNLEVITLISKIRDAAELIEAQPHIKSLQVVLKQFHHIKTSNYGGIETDLKTEWNFVVNPDTATDKGHSINEKLSLHPELDSFSPSRRLNPFTKQECHQRHPAPLQYFLDHDTAKQAKLTKPEVIGLRLYTGPSYAALNPSLRYVLQEELRYRMGNACTTTVEDKLIVTPEGVGLGAALDPVPQKGLMEQVDEKRKNPAQKQLLRDRFLECCKNYYGVPYKRKFHDDSMMTTESPGVQVCNCGKEGCKLFRSHIFLDCCGLVRQVMRDLKLEFGFEIGPWNQAYQFDTLPIRYDTWDQMKPGDLVFAEGKYLKEGMKPQKGDIVHVEVFLGGGPEGKSVCGARWNKDVIQEFDSYEFSPKSWTLTQWHFCSIDTWLEGICRSFHPKRKWRRLKRAPVQSSPPSVILSDTQIVSTSDTGAEKEVVSRASSFSSTRSRGPEIQTRRPEMEHEQIKEEEEGEEVRGEHDEGCHDSDAEADEDLENMQEGEQFVANGKHASILECDSYYEGAEVPQRAEQRGGFIVTASVINSGLKKLAKMSPLTNGRRLYRGLSKMAFDPKILKTRSFRDGDLSFAQVGRSLAGTIGCCCTD